MAARDRTIETLIERLTRLPGIGPKTAERLAFHLLRVPTDEALALARAIDEVRAAVKTCSRCSNLDAQDPCSICSDPARDPAIVLVIEDPREIARFEDTGYRGLYHVLQGRLSQLEGIRPDDLTTDQLMARITRERPAEVCLATNADLEGEGTARLVAERIAALPAVAGIRITRLARGLPAGSSIAQVSTSILADAIEGRRPVS